MDTPMPDTSSKLANLDYTDFLKKDSHHLSCPECEIIPALFIEKTSKNLFSISSGCENKHVVHNMSIREFYQKSLKKNEINEKETITLCQEHEEKYESFCKTCHKNICSQCLSKSHQDHNIIKFVDLQPSNNEIKNLKDSIKNEIKITSEFLTLEFNRWIDELKDKFEDLLEVISYKNKLYNQIISNYESGNLNYQVIHNIKIILKDQITRNPISKQLANLLKIIGSSKRDDKQPKFNEEKNKQFLNILDIENSVVEDNNTSRINSNFRNSLPVSNNINNPEQLLNDFINNPTRKIQADNQNNYNNQYNNSGYGNMNNLKKSISGQINFSNAYPNNQNMQMNNFGNNNQLRNVSNNNSNRNNYPNSNNYYNNSSFYSNKDNNHQEFQLTGKRLRQNLDVKEFILSMSLIKSSGAQKFAVGLENGIVKVFSLNENSGEISQDFEIKEHEKSITAVLGLNNGNLITCSQDKNLKVIRFPQNSLISIFKNYTVDQVLQCKPDAFYFTSVIEMNDCNIIVGDWKNIIIYKPFRKEGFNEGFEYREINQIVINNRTTALLQVDDGVFISAHCNIHLLNFYDTKRQRTRTLRDIRCSEDAQNCLCIISTRNGFEDDGDNTDKIVLVGGIQCIFFISVKYQSLIYKLFLPNVSYIRNIINTGYKFYSNNIICSGLFRQYSNDIVSFNIINQGGYNKFNLMESFKISDVDKGAINSILLLKKSNGNDQSSFFMVTGGNEQRIKVYN